MQALFGGTEAEIALLPRTKASQATSEAVLGRPCLPDSQRKWEIRWKCRGAPWECSQPFSAGHIWKPLMSARAAPINGLHFIRLSAVCGEKLFQDLCASVDGDKWVFAQLSTPALGE